MEKKTVMMKLIYVIELESVEYWQKRAALRTIILVEIFTLPVFSSFDAMLHENNCKNLNVSLLLFSIKKNDS